MLRQIVLALMVSSAWVAHADTVAPATQKNATRPSKSAHQSATTAQSKKTKNTQTATPAKAKQAASATDEHSVYRLNFASPSKNIVCGGDVLPAYGGAKGVSCYIKQMDSKSSVEKPESCDGNWGNVFELGQSGEAGLGCYTDTPYAQQPDILPYGQTIRGDGWICLSLMTGMKCMNQQKHGFEIGRKRQVFF